MLDLSNLKAIAPGQTLVIEGRKGWFYLLTGTEKGADLEVINPTEDLQGEKFFTFSTVGNPYGAGKIFQERTLGIQVGQRLIVGALVLDDQKKISKRFSWSNLVYIQNKTVEIVDGELFIDGVTNGFLKVAFLADKNRIDGFVGIFVPDRPEDEVKEVEMESLLLDSI